MNAAHNLSRAGALPCPGDLHHDAAVIEGANGCGWPDALDGAARGYGFGGLDDAASAIVADWRSRIVSAQPRTERGRDAVRDALRMLTVNGLDLVADGWGAVELFGLAPSGNRHGLAFLLRGGSVAWATGETIHYRRGATGRVCEHHRGAAHPDAAPFFELAAE